MSPQVSVRTAGEQSARLLLQSRLALQHGYALARGGGCGEPTLKDAVWELLMEAADTLKRLPNRERGWLTAASRAHWPDIVREGQELTLAASRKSARSQPDRIARIPASADAIDRMDTVLLWLPHAGGSKARRDVAVLFALACGVKVARLRQRFGCGRRTVYDIRDRALGRLCSWLDEQVGPVQ